MKTKICFKCKETKVIKDYYKHSGMTDGYLNKCIECTKDDVKNNYQKNMLKPEYVAKEQYRSREKYHRLGYKKRKLIRPKKRK